MRADDRPRRRSTTTTQLLRFERGRRRPVTKDTLRLQDATTRAVDFGAGCVDWVHVHDDGHDACSLVVSRSKERDALGRGRGNRLVQETPALTVEVSIRPKGPEDRRVRLHFAPVEGPGNAALPESTQ